MEENKNAWFTEIYTPAAKAFVLLIYTVYAKFWYMEGQINYKLNQGDEFNKFEEDLGGAKEEDSEEHRGHEAFELRHVRAHEIEPYPGLI